MSSKPQSEVNRVNGSKSAGRPRNRSRSRLNALNHGLLAVGVTELDDAGEYTRLLDQVRTERQPVGELELFLVERAVLSMVRIRRAVRLEADAITAALHPQRRSKPRIVEQLDAQAGDAWATTVIDPGRPAKLSEDTVGQLTNHFARYETLHERRFFRAISELERLQGNRTGQQHGRPPEQVRTHVR